MLMTSVSHYRQERARDMRRRERAEEGVGAAVTGLEDTVEWWYCCCLNPKAPLEVALSKVTLDQLLPSSFWSRKAHGSRDHFTSGTPPGRRDPFCVICPYQ